MTLHNTIITGSTVVGILLVGWLILAVLNRRLPKSAADVVSQLAPAVALSVVVIGVAAAPNLADVVAGPQATPAPMPRGWRLANTPCK